MTTLKADDNIEVEMKGVFAVTVTNRDTGEVVDEYKERNVLVLDSKTAITRAIAGNPFGVIRTIKLGNDNGGGTNDSPFPAQESYDENVMNVVYQKNSGIQVGYPNPITVAFNTTIRGDDVMDNYPGETNIMFCSAALHTNDGKVFAYKRFPQKSISGVLDISIVWSIGF